MFQEFSEVKINEITKDEAEPEEETFTTFINNAVGGCSLAALKELNKHIEK